MFPETEILGEKLFYVIQKISRTPLASIPESAFVGAVDALLQPATNAEMIFFYLLVINRLRDAV
jgi:hypothetical protein